MRYRIHGTASDGSEDSIIIDGDDLEELQKQAVEETTKRGWVDLWSEEL